MFAGLLSGIALVVIGAVVFGVAIGWAAMALASTVARHEEETAQRADTWAEALREIRELPEAGPGYPPPDRPHPDEQP